jgi:NTP pyrophosphatase (non-canonical NTP hydrolase)
MTLPLPALALPEPVRCRNQLCQRWLTDPDSIALGFGTKCAEERGLRRPRQPRRWVQVVGSGPNLIDLINQGANMIDIAAKQVAELSQWVDDANAHRDPEALTWQRLVKLSEEVGEVTAAYIGVTGSNPRKGKTHTIDDVRKELLDVATAALGAYEHMTGNKGESLDALVEFIASRHERAGLNHAAA